MAKGFEYKTVSRSLRHGDSYSVPDAALNTEGKNGWELIDVVVLPSRMLSNVMYEIWYFKREIVVA